MAKHVIFTNDQLHHCESTLLAIEEFRRHFYSGIEPGPAYQARFVEKDEPAEWLDHTKVLPNGHCLRLGRCDIDCDSVLLSISHITCTSSYPQASEIDKGMPNPSYLVMARAKEKNEH
ncbi:unnamed protein product [Ilex paraguariensis]|uniref:Uncharacterized protein n=1 Tax=Ilex paraguariensis TaxID=185542 RepID=A0ABC8V0J5_9AQUA